MTVTLRELTTMLGQVCSVVLLTPGGAATTVACRITDAREAYGRLDVQVVPLAGEGAVWTSAERVRIGAEYLPEDIRRTIERRAPAEPPDCPDDCPECGAHLPGEDVSEHRRTWHATS